MSVETDSSQSGAGPHSDATGEASQAEAPVAELDLASDAIGVELARLLAENHPAELVADAADAVAPVYDGHVALALDTDVLPQMDAALDMLTSSHQLFDVPAVDVENVIDDSLPT